MVDAAVAAEREQCARLLQQAKQEFEHAHVGHENALAAAAQQRAELLERQRLELHGSAEEALAAREARLKQARVDTMFARSGRRMTLQSVLRGWEAWKAQWAQGQRTMRLLAHGAARLARPQLAACLSAWVFDWRSWEDRTQGMNWDARLREQKHSAAADRIRLEEVIRQLERQLREHGLRASVLVPPPEPRVLLLHAISARGIPQGADGPAGETPSTDPYCRFLLLDDAPSAEGYSATAKRQMAFTSYLQNQEECSWDGERLQLLLTPGGDRPLRLCAEMWDKDMFTPDSQLAGTVVTLPDQASGVIKVRLPGCERAASGDVQELSFAFEMLAEAEPVPTRSRTRTLAFPWPSSPPSHPPSPSPPPPSPPPPPPPPLPPPPSCKAGTIDEKELAAQAGRGALRVPGENVPRGRHGHPCAARRAAQYGCRWLP